MMLEPQNAPTILGHTIPLPIPGAWEGNHCDIDRRLGFTICKSASANLRVLRSLAQHLPHRFPWWMIWPLVHVFLWLWRSMSWPLLPETCFSMILPVFLHQQISFWDKCHHIKRIMVWCQFDNKWKTPYKCNKPKIHSQKLPPEKKFEKGFPISRLLVKNQEMKKYPNIQLSNIPTT